MRKRMVWLAMLTATILVLAGLLVNELIRAADPASPEQSGMPLPGFEDVDEMIVVGEEGAAGSSMPVPGMEGVEEHIVTPEDQGVTVSSGMPVPGFEGIEEHIVIEE